MMNDILTVLAIWSFFYIPTAIFIVRSSRVIKLSADDIKELFPH